MIRRFLFQLHLWSGLILGVVFVLIGLSGSMGVFEPLFSEPPTVQATPAGTPALDKGLAAARAAVRAPQSTGATIVLPAGTSDPVLNYFGDELPAVATDPSSGGVLATFSVKQPDWFAAILDFHNGFFHPRANRPLEGWFGLGMVFLGLSGLYLWWPRPSRWSYGFIVRRSAKGLRFHRELHGAAGIWTLVIYLMVTATGLVYGFPQTYGRLITFVTGQELPHYTEGTPVVAASGEVTLLGPDAALTAARKAGNRPVQQLKMPGWEPGRPTLSPIIAQTGTGPGMRVYLDPYHGTVIPNPAPPPNNAYKLAVAIDNLHAGRHFGPVYTVLVFISGLMPLIFFVTGIMMWMKKRQNKLAMSQPLPENILEQQAL